MLGKRKFERLNEPGRIGRVKTKNRMVKPAQSLGFSTEDGYVSDTSLAHYEVIAQSGVGLLIVESAGVDFPAGHLPLGWLLINDDKFIARLGELTKLIHSHGVPTFLQLIHWGPSQMVVPGVQARSSSTMGISELPRKTYGPTLGLTIAEIEGIVEKFAEAAKRAEKAGFDGVEVHGAHGYLINSFLSGAWNKREDRYGGSLENRARLAGEIIRAIKARVGKEFPVGIRVNGAEYGVKGGLTPNESQALCRMIQESGADHIHVSAFGFGLYNRVVNPEQLFYPEAPKPLGEGLDGSRKGAGALTLLASGIKRAVSIPVIAVGRLDPILAEEVLRQGRADFIAMGRCLLADPQAPRKVMEGRVEDIAPCTGCIMCIDSHVQGKPVVCRINALLGREREYALRPAEQKKKVMVVGGGPSGMEAARASALRGHEVILYERAHRLGGALSLVGLVKGLEVEDLVALTRYFQTQLRKLGVEVRLGVEVDEGLIRRMNPDAVILATGGTAVTPEIPGINRPIVADQSWLHRTVKPYLRIFGPRVLRWLTNFYLPLGKRVVIIGGGIQGIELAEFLVKRGRKVTVTETSDALGAELAGYTKERLLAWLAERGCALMSGVRYEEITDKGLALVTKEGKKQFIEADTILPALRLRPNADFFESLKGKFQEVYLIGDAREPHLILEAVHEGFKTALAI